MLLNYTRTAFSTAAAIFITSVALAQVPKTPSVTFKDNQQKSAAAASGAPRIKNNIVLNSKVLRVSQAYLLFDDGSSVPANNKIALNQRVNMILTITSGWSEREGQVFPGGSEVLKLSDGNVIVESDDVFKAYDETGVAAKDASYITLKAIITKMDDKKKFVIVNFKVWDKKGVGEITGSYKLFIL